MAKVTIVGGGNVGAMTALYVSEKEVADVILLDLKLGDTTGDQFLAELRSRKLYTPVVVLSGIFPRAEVEERLRKFKIVDIMEKPVKAKDLIAKVDQAAQVAEQMVALSVSTDRLREATKNLRQVADAHITDTGGKPF